MSAAYANVVRNGVRQSIVANEVVFGGVLLIEEGDIITADGRLFESTSLQMAEATLTGESLPVAGNARRHAARWLDQRLRRHAAVVYVPYLQQAFSTVSLSAGVLGPRERDRRGADALWTRTGRNWESGVKT
jgi:P-type E1-E2 ATPase